MVAMLFFDGQLILPDGGIDVAPAIAQFRVSFILIALVAGRTSFLARLAPRIGGYARIITSIFLVATGVLTLVFDQHPLLDPLYGVW